MTQVDVQIASHPKSYRIHIEAGLLQQAGNFLSALSSPRQCCIISDEMVSALYSETLAASLIQAGFSTHSITVPTGEVSKSLDWAEKIYTQLQQHQYARQDIIVALGGGVVGDLGGFCAATYKRGLRLVQIPTTLLAQVDSSVGGKVAVNFGGLKNNIGTFYQPDAVLIDPTVLNSLPERDYKAGLGEVVKYALLTSHTSSNASFLDWLEKHVKDIQTKTPNVLSSLIARCCQMKAAAVAQDETDKAGIRAILNLGHTFAHALESSQDLSDDLHHGEAVGIGLVLACRLSNQLGLMPVEETQRLVALMHTLGLRIEPPKTLNPETLLAHMRQDKKSDGHSITFILPYGQLGTVIQESNISDETLLSLF